jgi:dihydroorotase
VFTQPYATQLVLSALELACERGVLSEREVTREKLEGFLGGFGREFYGVRDERGEKIEVWKGEEVVREEVRGEDGVRIVPFWRGRGCWSLKWVE